MTPTPMPTSGGSYIRHADGTLTLDEPPTQDAPLAAPPEEPPADPAPVEPVPAPQSKKSKTQASEA